MNNLLRQSKQFLNRNSATILTCVGGVGVIVTSIMAVKATPKALKLVDHAKEEKGEELTKLEVVRVAGPAYIPAVVTGAATLACIFGANALNKHKQASLMSAYALLDNSYKEYKKKVEEMYGEEAGAHIREEIAKDHYEEEDPEVSENKQLFFDNFSMRYFESTMEDVIHAEYLLNRNLSISGYVCVNEFYDLLDVPTIEGGDELGWSACEMVDMHWYSWIEFHHEKVVMDDGLECYIITMPYEPVADYMNY